MSEVVNDIVQLRREIDDLRQAVAEHRHHRDPEWDMWTRNIDRTGRATYTDHFRSGTIPSGFAWVNDGTYNGAPGGAGGGVNYSYHETYLSVTVDASPHWLAAAVGSYANKWFIARCESALGCHLGIRVDDGTNNNSAEFYVASQSDLTVRLGFQSYAAGVPTTTTSPQIRADYPFVLLMYYYNATPAIWGYLGKESNRWEGAIGFGTGAIAWTPSRIGLVFRNNSAYDTLVDFFTNEWV